MSEPIHPRLLKALLAKQLAHLLDRLEEIDALDAGQAADLEAARGNYAVRLTVTRGQPATLPLHQPGPPRQLPPDAPRLYRQLLAKAAAEPKTARQLIREAGYGFHTTSRAGVSWLVHHGYLIMAGNNRYCLPAAAGNLPA